MLDADFLLIPVMSDNSSLCLKARIAQRNSWRGIRPSKNETFQELWLQNVNHITNLSKAFAENPTRENLVLIRDPTVGDWKESGTGLGYGIYPFDVECTFSVPQCLPFTNFMI